MQAPLPRCWLSKGSSVDAEIIDKMWWIVINSAIGKVSKLSICWVECGTLVSQLFCNDQHIHLHIQDVVVLIIWHPHLRCSYNYWNVQHYPIPLFTSAGSPGSSYPLDEVVYLVSALPEHKFWRQSEIVCELSIIDQIICNCCHQVYVAVILSHHNHWVWQVNDPSVWTHGVEINGCGWSCYLEQFGIKVKDLPSSRLEVVKAQGSRMDACEVVPPSEGEVVASWKWAIGRSWCTQEVYFI